MHIEQKLVNEGEEPVHCCRGEHIALGPPFLSNKCVIDLPGGGILNHPAAFHENNRLQKGHESEWPITKFSDGEYHDLTLVPGKDLHSYDQSYIVDMREGWYGITNTEIGVGVAYPVSHYKYLWYW